MDKKELTLSAQAITALGVTENAGVDAISAAIVALHARAQAAESTLADQKKAVATALVDKAIREGRLTADKKEVFTDLAVKDFANAQAVIESIPARQTLADRIKPGNKSNQASERDDWDYKKWLKEDPKGLQQLRADHPEAFEELKARYAK